MTPLILHQTSDSEARELAEAAARCGLALQGQGLPEQGGLPARSVVVLGSLCGPVFSTLRRLAADPSCPAVLVLVPDAVLEDWRKLLALSPLAPLRAEAAACGAVRSWPDALSRLAVYPAASPGPLAGLVDQLCACAPAGFAVLDRSLRVLSANSQFADIIGLPEASLAGRPAREWFGNEISLEPLPGPPGGARTLVLRRPDGALRDLELTSGTVPLADGTTGLLLSFRDISRRTQAQAELRRSERRLRHVVDLVPHMIFLKDASGRFTLVNQEAANLYATTVEQLTGRAQADFHPHPDELTAMLASDRDVIETGRRADSPEVPFTTRGGQRRWLSVIKVPFQPEPGQPANVLGIALDVTDLRLAREELRRANQELEKRVNERTSALERAGHDLEEERHLFTTLLDNLPERIYFKDRESRFIRGNRAILAQFGLAREADLVGRTDADCFTPEHAAPARADELRIMETGVPILEKEERETFPDGRFTWSATTKMALRDRQGRVIGTFGISRDITARKRMEEDLAQERLLMANLMESIPDKIFFKDADSRFIRVNKAHASQFNLPSPEDAVGRSDGDYLSPENASAARSDELGLLNQSQAIINREMREVLANGRKRWIHVTKLPLRDKDGLIIGTFGVVRDITARRKAEDEANKASEMLRAIIDSIPDRIVVKDTEGRMLISNRAHRKFLGRELAKSAQGKLITELFNVPWAHAALESDLRVIRTGQKEVNQEELVELGDHKEGHWMVTSKVPLINKRKKETFGMVVISHDITKRKRMEDKLRDSRRSLQVRNESMNADLEMARQVQQAFLPQKFPDFPQGSPPAERTLAFGHHYEASSKLAGDFFNVIRLTDTRAGLLVCDVMGHGLRAALFTAMIRGLIEEMRPIADDPGAFLTEINKGLLKVVLPNDETPIFVTACYIVVDVAIRRFRYANAGHPAPLLLRAATGEITPLDSEGDEPDPALGFEDGLVFKARKGTISVGDTFLLHTDGLTEARCGEEEYGEQRLRDAFRANSALSPEGLVSKLVEEVQSFSGRRDFNDDICVLAARVLATPNPNE